MLEAGSGRRGHAGAGAGARAGGARGPAGTCAVLAKDQPV